MTMLASPLGTATRYAVHGVAFVVGTDVPAAAAAVADSYGVFATDAGPLDDPAPRLVLRHAPDGYRLTDGEGRTRTLGREVDAVVALFDAVVSTALAGLTARGMLGIHAGAVAVGGRGLVLAGPSGHGKSTLTLATMRHGAELLSDEMAVIAPDDRTLLPFPRSLHIRPDTLAMFPELAFVERRPRYDLGGGSEWAVTARDLAAAFGASLGGATDLAAVVLLDGRPDADRPVELEPVPAAVATMELLRGVPAAGRDFAGTLRRLSAILAHVRCARLRMGRLDASAAAVTDWLGISA